MSEQHPAPREPTSGAGARQLTHDELRSLLGAFAVHALDDDEYLAVDGHLRNCHPCSVEVAALREASSAIGLTELEEPPPQLLSRILADMRSDVPAVEQPKTQETPEAVLNPTQPDAGRAHSLDARRAVRAQHRRTWQIASAVAVAAVALAVPITAALSGSSPPSLAALAKRAGQRNDARIAELRDTNGMRVGDVVLTPDGQGYLRSAALPALPVGRTYQLWAVIDGTPVSAGLLGGSPTTAAFTVRAVSGTSHVQAMAVSIELPGGASAPSAAPVAAAAFA